MTSTSLCCKTAGAGPRRCSWCWADRGQRDDVRVDSIPAIFAITTDPFIVFTSNIFAIMGLRALYFLLADMADRSCSSTACDRAGHRHQG
ncbi:TerC family protein [Pseudomonas chlororaphis]|uniref:TerC family protein n=1 Tax=Pseudomonas chlororaphis TaxID=587753 RepID=UPI003BF8D338